MGNSSDHIKSETKTVIIIGAGFAGLDAYKLLSPHFNTFVVDSKNFFEYTPSIHYCFAEQKAHETIIRPFEMSTIKKDAFIHGKAIELKAHSLVVQTPDCGIREFTFDYCIIANGSHYPASIRTNDQIITLEDRKLQIQEIQTKIKNAKRIFIKGTGAVGVELAGELADKGQEVYLIARGNRILAHFNQTAQNKARTQLLRIGVKIIDESDLPQDYEQTDLVFDCIGNSWPKEDNLLKANFPKCLDEQGRVRVNRHMQMITDMGEVHINIFAAGDTCINEINEEKAAYPAKLGGGIAAKNIKIIHSNLTGPKSVALQCYPTNKNDILQLWNISIGKQSLFTTKTTAYLGRMFTGMKSMIERKSLNDASK